MNDNTNNTHTNNTNNTALGREAARFLALWLAERKEVSFAAPGEEVPVVTHGYQCFGSGGYSASGRVVGPHTVVGTRHSSNGFVTTTVATVRGENGTVAVSTESDCYGVNGRRWSSHVAWLSGLPAVPEQPGDGGAPVNPDAWRAYWAARAARAQHLLAQPEVLRALWRASAPDTASALDARLHARAEVGEDAHDALVGQPAALRILYRMRRAARDLSHQPALVREPFDITARAVMSARTALSADASLDEVCAAVRANIAAEETFVAAAIAAERAAEDASRAAADARAAAAEAARAARARPDKVALDKRPVRRL